MQNEKTVNYTQNCLKGMACILVVLNHFHHQDIFWGGVEYTISHLGVPIFYMISGYYLWAGNGDLEYRKIKKRIRHTIKLIVVFILVTLVYQLLISLVNSHGLSDFTNFLLGRITVERIIRTIFLSESLVGLGEWFLWGMLEAYFLFLISYKVKFFSMIRNNALLTAAALLFIHTIIRWVLILTGLSNIGAINLYATYSVRNVWFDALPFMLIGYGLRKKYYRRCEQSENKPLSVLFFMSLLLGVAESIILKNVNSNVNCVLYLGIILADIAILKLSICNPEIGSKSVFEFVGKNLSMIVYFTHVEIESIVSKAAELLKINDMLIYRILYPFIIITFALIAAEIIFLIKDTISCKRGKVLGK